MPVFWRWGSGSLTLWLQNEVQASWNSLRAMNHHRHDARSGQIGYGCLMALILMAVPVACFAVIFLWNVNAAP